MRDSQALADLGGIVDVQSELGQGTTFLIHLPRAAEPAGELPRRTPLRLSVRPRRPSVAAPEAQTVAVVARPPSRGELK